MMYHELFCILGSVVGEFLLLEVRVMLVILEVILCMLRDLSA